MVMPKRVIAAEVFLESVPLMIIPTNGRFYFWPSGPRAVQQLPQDCIKFCLIGFYEKLEISDTAFVGYEPCKISRRAGDGQTTTW